MTKWKSIISLYLQQYWTISNISFQLYIPFIRISMSSRPDNFINQFTWSDGYYLSNNNSKLMIFRKFLLWNSTLKNSSPSWCRKFPIFSDVIYSRSRICTLIDTVYCVVLSRQSMFPSANIIGTFRSFIVFLSFYRQGLFSDNEHF